MTYTPELGQAAFGQPYQHHDMPDEWVACITVLGLAIKAAHGGDPTSNSGARFECPVFSMHAYSWGDEEQPWNFKFGEVEGSWYKYIGRGCSANQAMCEADPFKALTACLVDIDNGALL